MAHDPGDGVPGHLTPADGAARLPGPGGERFAALLSHGSLVVEYYAPRGRDAQSPHTRDELYVVIAGEGWFVNGPRRHRFSAGDVLFVPAGAVHRFEEFGDDFATWVMFYGPEGGEPRQDLLER
ncbi:MAG TPA: cupin domain-containing protein [Casimicrobiaceae bacterium]|nr:cupin domain-containing protein [Casimicrobiaceae bacterium]